jgi:hypothetical protein
MVIFTEYIYIEMNGNILLEFTRLHVYMFMCLHVYVFCLCRNCSEFNLVKFLTMLVVE